MDSTVFCSNPNPNILINFNKLLDYSTKAMQADENGLDTDQVNLVKEENLRKIWLLDAFHGALSKQELVKVLSGGESVLMPFLGHLPNNQDLKSLQLVIDRLFSMTTGASSSTLSDFIVALRTIIDSELNIQGLPSKQALS